MNSPISADQSPENCWGTSRRFPRKEWWMVLAEIYETRPIWRQVLFSVVENQANPKDLESEVSSVMDSLLKKLKAQLDSPAILPYLGPFTKATSLPVLGGTLYDPPADWLPHILLEHLSTHLAPAMTARIMDGVQASLAIQPERTPLNLNRVGERGERYAGQQQPTRRLRAVPRHRNPSGLQESESAQTVVGRTIWDPQLMPILVPRTDIPYLLQGREHLALQRVKVNQEQEEVILNPVPWWRLDVIWAMIHPIATLPLAAMAWPPDPAALDAIRRDLPAGAPSTTGLDILAGALEATTDFAWWTLADLLDPTEEPLGKYGPG